MQNDMKYETLEEAVEAPLNLRLIWRHLLRLPRKNVVSINCLVTVR